MQSSIGQRAHLHARGTTRLLYPTAWSRCDALARGRCRNLRDGIAHGVNINIRRAGGKAAPAPAAQAQQLRGAQR